MLINDKQIIGLTVETQSGQHLGKISGFNLESETQTIYQYEVKPSGLNKIFSHQLLVHQKQVISLTKEKMIVDDLIYKEIATSLPVEIISAQQ